MSCKKIWLTDRSMDSCERQRRAAITFSVINQSLLLNRSEMSLERAQRLLPQNPGADEPHLTSRREFGSWPETGFWEVRGARVLCMKMTFQVPACFSRKADSNQFWLVVPDASVMLPSLV